MTKLEKGDIIELELERRTIYDNWGHVPAGKISKKTFRVAEQGRYGISLRPVRKAKKVRGWALNPDQTVLNSHTKPPLKYDVLRLTVKKRAKTESLRDLAQQLRETTDGA